MLAIFAYVGADPGGQAPPDLMTVPVPPSGDPNNSFRFVLAFAKDDGTGNFAPGWDPTITPNLVAQMKQNNSNISFWASLGGDANYGGTWTAPSDPGTWINNATNSLLNIINTYQLSGLDIDYEAGTSDPTFAAVFGQALINVFDQLGGLNSGFDFSYSPFSQTAADYLNLYLNVLSTNVFVTYQAYDGEYSDVQGYMTLYSQLAKAYGSYSQLGLGICSSTSAPRGLQPPDIYTALTNLQGQGVQVASIFCLEDSANNGYPIETTLLSDFTKKGAVPPHRAA